MVRHCNFGSIVLRQRHYLRLLLLLCEEDAISPGRHTPLIARVVCRLAKIILVSRVEQKLAFLALFEHRVSHSKHVKLVLSHQCLVILAGDRLIYILSSEVNPEIEVPKGHEHVMILNLIVLVLRTPLPLVPLLVKIAQLLMPLRHILKGGSPRQMAIHKDKSGVLKAESHHHGSLLARVVAHGRAHVRHRHVKDSRLNLSLGDQEQ